MPSAAAVRHVDLLASGGILGVAEERRVRGAVERGYRLRQDRAVIDADTVRSLSADDHWRGFATAMAAPVAEFTAYLDRERADPAGDVVGYRQHAVWLSRAELEAMIGALRAVIAPCSANEPAPGRARYLLSPILFPNEEPAADPGS
ncbi:ArsR family transcriptional regulator [Amycolatopsis sp. NPDC058986]|uniref:ArsR family transcriptional regulator n=1 Tax=unclassified Amycolatopsis TaxID=2618356 RepID=UPI00366A9B0D